MAASKEEKAKKRGRGKKERMRKEMRRNRKREMRNGWVRDEEGGREGKGNE